LFGNAEVVKSKFLIYIRVPVELKIAYFDLEIFSVDADIYFASIRKNISFELD
jgi:hypothetical protein